MTNAEFTALANAALVDRLTLTFGVAGADAKGNTIIVRVAPPTPAELAWMAVCKPRHHVNPNLKGTT